MFTDLWCTYSFLFHLNNITMKINSLLEYIMSLHVYRGVFKLLVRISRIGMQGKTNHKKLHTALTISRCSSPLISMASRLSNEHRREGNVISNWPTRNSNQYIKETHTNKNEALSLYYISIG